MKFVSMYNEELRDSTNLPFWPRSCAPTFTRPNFSRLVRLGYTVWGEIDIFSAWCFLEILRGQGELGQVSWAAARDLVKPVCEAMSSGGCGD